MESSQKLQYPNWATFIQTTMKFFLAAWVFLKYAEFEIAFVGKSEQLFWLKVLEFLSLQ